jgi:hypothetical protein
MTPAPVAVKGASLGARVWGWIKSRPLWYLGIPVILFAIVAAAGWLFRRSPPRRRRRRRRPVLTPEAGEEKKRRIRDHADAKLEEIDKRYDERARSWADKFGPKKPS